MHMKADNFRSPNNDRYDSPFVSVWIYTAVKKLDNKLQDARTEFKAEVNSIANTHNKNLVHAIGFCEDWGARTGYLYTTITWAMRL